MSISALLGLGTVTIFALWAWYIMSKEENKDKQFHQVMLEFVTLHRKNAFVMILSAMSVVSAIVAASSPALDVPPVPRFLVHLGVAVLTIFFGIPFYEELGSFVKSFKDKPWSFKISFVRLLKSSFVIFGALILPLFNFFAILAAYKQITPIYMLYMQLWGTDVDFILATTRYGLPITYSPVEYLSPITIGEIIITVCTYVIILYEGCDLADKKKKVAPANPAPATNPANPANPTNPAPATNPAPPTQAQGAFISNIEALIKFVDVDARKIPGIVKQVEQQMVGMNATDTSAISIQYAAYRSSMSAARTPDDIKAVKDTIRSAFAKTRAQKGFGITLPQPTTNPNP